MSSLDYGKSVKLLHHHVIVKTTVKRGPDFISPFALSNQQANNNKNTSETLQFAGYLKVLDPISNSAILCLIDDDYHIKENLLILGQNIDLIEPSQSSQETLSVARVRDIIETDSAKKLSSLPFFQRLNNKDELNINKEEISKKGREIADWLSANRIPHQLNADTFEIIIGEMARLRPPYEHESNYICPTRIMLKRIMHIVDSRPTNKTTTNTDTDD